MIDNRVEKYMPPVDAAILRHMNYGPGFTDIYNRAYEAVSLAIDEAKSSEIIDLRAKVEELEQHDRILSASDVIKAGELAQALQRAVTAEAQAKELIDACKAMVEYRDRVGAMGWQLEKADDYIRNIRSLIAKIGGQG